MLTDIKLNPSCTFVEFAVNGEIFRVRQWGNMSTARGIVLMVHGLGAHGGWFEAAAREFAQRGFVALAYDQRGFGGRAKLQLRSCKQWTDELAALARQVRDSSELPVYLLGNSMGALVVMAAAALVEVSGIIICSPGFDGHPQAFSLAYKLKSIWSALFCGQQDVALPYQIDFVTRNATARSFVLNDLEKRLAVPGAMLLELLKLSRGTIAGLKAVKAPVLMITAGQERVVNNAVSEKLFARLTAPSKKHICMNEAWHDLMFDPQIDEVVEEIVKWQDELKQPAALSSLSGR